VIATQALELGIDVGSLDLALVTGFPGTVTSLWQRWGRAGRVGHGYAVLVAGSDALDQYFMREPDRLLSRAVEEAIIDLDNPYISAAHLEAAAYEQPLTDTDRDYFGEAALIRAEGLVQAGRLRRQPAGLAWTRPHSPAAQTSLRSASSEQYVIVETAAGTVLGTVERERVFRLAHPGAVYLAPWPELPRAATRPGGAHGAGRGVQRRLLHTGQDRQEPCSSPVRGPTAPWPPAPCSRWRDRGDGGR